MVNGACIYVQSTICTRAAHDSCTDPRAALTAALEAVDNALTVFDPVHMHFYHTKATRLRDRIRAALDALPRG